MLFLRQGGRDLIVAEGEEIAGLYRLERIAGDHAQFEYLPLHEMQNLPSGPTSEVNFHTHHGVLVLAGCAGNPDVDSGEKLTSEGKSEQA